IQVLLNGIMLGVLYAVVGVGLAAVFGIMRVTNLAHGDLMVVASYLSLITISHIGGNPFLSLIIVVPLMFLVGFGLQYYLLNRAINKGPEPPLLTTFGLMIIVENGLLLVFSPDAHTLANGLVVKSIPLTANLNIPVIYLIDFLVGVAVILGFALFLKKTYLGLAIRAASDDDYAAALQGINAKMVYAYTMGAAMVTAAIAGVLVGMTFTFNPYSGSQYLILAFGVVVIGGLGSVSGTLAAGIILGVAQLLGAYYIGTGSQLLAAYLVLLIVLAVRPQGLFSRA
ncbi:MAG TPA: branched-chain amino acid ABC transporter permease, partial [Spirochaetia bacterium]|nr:branched-chain amino acid ABC transporter permease [Spirochaetia bacterium]